ncbi:MAG: patatin-like phospholipase family protein [Betaproteobacteria bacterium]|nr:patatin-like phospholipase family protein [Betaproteobacteria bacterium]
MTATLKSLIVQAGPRALKHLREHGLRPQDIDIVPGAAGGPKGLGLARLDEHIFADWLPKGFAQRTQPIDLIGSSIGAWRFAAVCRGHTPEETRSTLRAFAKAYSEQNYPRKVDADFITAYARDLIDNLFKGFETELLSHPNYRLNVLVVRGKGILRHEARGRSHAGFMMAAFANAVGRPHLRHFLDRTWFHAGPAGGIASQGNWDRFHTDHIALSPDNFGDALIASGSIPLVLRGVTQIAGAPGGTYWDGGIIDYHLHLPYPRSSGLVLYPHFTDCIVPGWLDKALPWRKASGAWLDNVILVSPSRDYLDRLPMKKLPDRNDFKRYVDDYDARLKYWRFAMDESERLAEEFRALCESPALIEKIRTL